MWRDSPAIVTKCSWRDILMWRNSYFLLILFYVYFVNKIFEHTLKGFVLVFAFFIPVKLARTIKLRAKHASFSDRSFRAKSVRSNYAWQFAARFARVSAFAQNELSEKDACLARSFIVFADFTGNKKCLETSLYSTIIDNNIPVANKRSEFYM